MLDIKFVKDHPDLVKKNLEKRHLTNKLRLVDEVVTLYKKRLAIKQDVDMLRGKRNVASQEINKLRKEGKDVKAKITAVQKIPEEIAALEKKQKKLQQELGNLLLELPNILHESVPDGKVEADNPVIKTWGKPTKHNFELVNHGELIEAAGLADFETGRTVSGQGFNYLLGDMALLDLALQRYGIEVLVKNGFTPVIPPLTLHYGTLLGVLNGLEDFKDVVYKIADEDAYLIGTAEHALIALMSGKLLEQKKMPLKLCAVTPCFRKEIGSTGVDTKGLFRMHQFNKVEQVVFTDIKSSFKILDELQKISEQFFQDLEIPYQVVEICSGDLGAKQAKQYDIEAWFPRQQKYREVTSASSCTDYQSRALGIKYVDKNKEKQYAHIVNNTMVATSRAMVAILENFQQKDGSVKIPKVLQHYMYGKKVINSQ